MTRMEQVHWTYLQADDRQGTAEGGQGVACVGLGACCHFKDAIALHLILATSRDESFITTRHFGETNTHNAKVYRPLEDHTQFVSNNTKSFVL